MNKNYKLRLFLIVFILFLGIGTIILKQNPNDIIFPVGNAQFQRLKISNVEYSNATVISDGYNDIYWNDGVSISPDIAVDNNGTVHAIWEDLTHGIWGSDQEILYASYTKTKGWSNITAISDGNMGIYWNTDASVKPALAVDGLGNVHAVWTDHTDGIWGNDSEIMHAKYTKIKGWSNATVISDGYNDIYWNDGISISPDIAADDSGNVHVVWTDYTDGVWGVDTEIMHVNYSEVDGWSNVTIVSDGHNLLYWNTGNSYLAAIALDNSGGAHVVWKDHTDGIWGDNPEIMYSSLGLNGWNLPMVVSDGHNSIYWNNHTCYSPDIAVDNSGGIHVVWCTYMDGGWGTDSEIMYSTLGLMGWSHPKVVSEGYNDQIWNTGGSDECVIATDGSGGLHVVWADYTAGTWGGGSLDYEIMYAMYTKIDGWSNATVISDGYNDIYWNDGVSNSPDIAVDNSGKLHVIWRDSTDGIWGTDPEIMYTSVSIPPTEESTPSGGIPFGNFFIVIMIFSVLGLVLIIKRKL